MSQWVEVLSYKAEGCGFDSRCCLWEFFIAIILRSVQPTTLPLSWADCLEIWKPQFPGTVCGIALPFTLYTTLYIDCAWSSCSNTVSNRSLLFTCSLKKGIVSCFVEYPNVSMGGYIKAKNSLSHKHLSADR